MEGTTYLLLSGENARGMPELKASEKYYFRFKYKDERLQSKLVKVQNEMQGTHVVDCSSTYKSPISLEASVWINRAAGMDPCVGRNTVKIPADMQRCQVYAVWLTLDGSEVAVSLDDPQEPKSGSYMLFRCSVINHQWLFDDMKTKEQLKKLSMKQKGMINDLSGQIAHLQRAKVQEQESLLEKTGSQIKQLMAQKAELEKRIQLLERKSREDSKNMKEVEHLCAEKGNKILELQHDVDVKRQKILSAAEKFNKALMDNANMQDHLNLTKKLLIDQKEGFTRFTAKAESEKTMLLDKIKRLQQRYEKDATLFEEQYNGLKEKFQNTTLQLTSKLQLHNGEVIQMKAKLAQAIAEKDETASHMAMLRLQYEAFKKRTRKVEQGLTEDLKELQEYYYAHVLNVGGHAEIPFSNKDGAQKNALEGKKSTEKQIVIESKGGGKWDLPSLSTLQSSTSGKVQSNGGRGEDLLVKGYNHTQALSPLHRMKEMQNQKLQNEIKNFGVGSQVYAKCYGTSWTPGVILRINPDGTFQVKYGSTGIVESNVVRENIRHFHSVPELPPRRIGLETVPNFSHRVGQSVNPLTQNEMIEKAKKLSLSS
eukprot:g4971.t1